jgi:hypothetical protein
MLMIPLPETTIKRGVFTDQSLQKLYNELRASGLQSKEAAFRAGAKVEEVDIRDLKAALAELIMQICNQLINT